MEGDIKDINIFGDRSANESVFGGNFLDYLKSETPGKPSPPKNDPIMDSVKEMYNHLNRILEQNALPLMGDFWKLEAMEIQKTLNLITDLMKRKGDDAGTRVSISEGTFWLDL